MKIPSLMGSVGAFNKIGQKLHHLWRKVVEPPSAIQDPEIRRRVRVTNGLVVMIVPVAFVAFVAQMIIDPFEDMVRSTTIPAIGLGVTIALLIYFLNKVTRSFWIVGWFAMAVGFVAILVVALTSTPPHFEFTFLIFLPLVGTMLFSLWETFLLCVLTVFSLVVVAGSMPTMPRDTLKDLIVFVVLAQAFILFVAQQRNGLEADRQELALEKVRNDLLSKLIANLTHDFRTPLAIINTSAYLLGRSADSQTNQDKIDRIAQETTRINTILDDILTISKLDYTFNICPEPLDINNVLSEMAERFAQKIESKHLHFKLDLAQDVRSVVASPEYLSRAIVSIIENAVQFTPDSGSVTIRSLNAHRKVVVEVIDTGEGVDGADLKLVFNPFFRGDSARSSETGGAGLGLSIAKRVIEMHSGQIEIESMRGSGSTVRIMLPVDTRT